eukprot:GHVR01024125.1.p1 GENE.GHVR01024125.1~~GHVR01024125.1.p1  ORF type:complete len:205 (-),score=46.12 GHVR01024125.1:119-685(-)
MADVCSGSNSVTDIDIKGSVKRVGWEFWESIGSPRHVLAPMVDHSELPFRMLTRRYGVGVCYTPMINSKMFCEHKKYRQQVFTSCVGDRPLIAQFCGDNPDTIVKAAKMIEKDVDAVDLNLGCPQGIARRGHYGSYLLKETELVKRIVRSMCEGLCVPVCVKFRKVSDDIIDTITLAKELQSCVCMED